MGQDTMLRKSVDRYGPHLRHGLNDFMARYSRIDDRDVFGQVGFEYPRLFERNWRQVRAEADAVMAAGDIRSLGLISRDHRRLDSKHKWRSYFSWGYGLKIPANCDRCPITTRLGEEIPGLLTAITQNVVG